MHAALPRGLDPSTVTSDNLVVTREDGQVVPTKVHVYYGSNSHLLNIKPKQDWPTDARFTVTISPPLSAWDGTPLETSYSFAFATLPEPNPPEIQPEAVDVIEPGPDAVEVVEPGTEALEAVEPESEQTEALAEATESAPEPAPEAEQEIAEAASDTPDGANDGPAAPDGAPLGRRTR